MVPARYQWMTAEFEPEGDPRLPFVVAQGLERDGNLEGAATLYDRAYGLDPDNPDIARARDDVLDRLAVVEHGLTFRYIPGGVFLMGEHFREPDERPWHPVWLSPFWLTETPVSWADFEQLMGWNVNDIQAVYQALPESERFTWSTTWKLANAYSADPPGFGRGGDPRAEPRFDTKPAVGISWAYAQRLGERLSTRAFRYGLPTEAQWEKAARGGRIGSKHSWGDDLPSPKNCDCERFTEISILPSRTFRPNSYGLYAMCGGVWEWCVDWYDRDYYAQSPECDPAGPETGEEKVLRGGAWSDCKDVCTVTFRMSRPIRPDEYGHVTGHLTPTIGFRLCRSMPPTPSSDSRSGV